MNKQDNIIYENAKKEVIINLDIMIQHSPSQDVISKLLEIERIIENLKGDK